MIWLPTVWTGLKAVIGSWKIIEISFPLILLISLPCGVQFRQIRYFPSVPICILVQKDLPLNNPPGLGDNLQDRLGGDTFSPTTFSDDTQGSLLCLC